MHIRKSNVHFTIKSRLDSLDCYHKSYEFFLIIVEFNQLNIYISSVRPSNASSKNCH